MYFFPFSDILGFKGPLYKAPLQSTTEHMGFLMSSKNPQPFSLMDVLELTFS